LTKNGRSDWYFSRTTSTSLPRRLRHIQAALAVELFFKWVKQHLRIKSFYGTSQNAVKSQIWVGLCIYLLVAITKKRLGIDARYIRLQIIEVNIFEKKPILF